MQTNELSRLLNGIELSFASLAERSGVDPGQLETLRTGRAEVPAGAQSRLAREIRAHAALLERAADGLEQTATSAPAQVAPVPPPPTPLAHADPSSKVKIAVGAVGLLMFIVGVRRFAPGRPADTDEDAPTSFEPS